MKVLIIENEIYLAQSISIKLSEIGYQCEIVNSFDENLNKKYYDVILLSTSTNNYLQAVEKFKNSIIILLIAYISTDTVSTPLKMGANDYVQKPFMMEELIRKIKHYQEYKKMLLLNQAYKNYMKSSLETVKLPDFNFKKIKFPLILKSNKQSSADAFVFNYVHEFDLTLIYIDLCTANSVEKVTKITLDNNLLFLANFQVLKPAEKEKLIQFAFGKNIIIHTNTNIENIDFTVINLNDNEKHINSDEILTIDEYVKYIILTYQNIFPDTDLSKKLGISRKSLWEKRKRYEIKKK